MNRLVSLLALLPLGACFNFDAAYDTYCVNARCDAGASTGGGTSSGGGSSSGGGTTAGGTAGGSTAGGSTAGGSTAGGAAGGSAGGSAGGTVDAGVMCVGQPFCVHKFTARTDFKAGDAVVGDSLDLGYAFFSKYSPDSTLFVEHGPGANGTGRMLASLAPPLKIFGGSANDFFVISRANLTTASIFQIVDAGFPSSFYSGTCMGQDFFANSYDRDVINNRLLIGGRNEGICALNLATRQTTILQPDTMASPIQYVEDLYAAPSGEIFYGTDDGYIGKQGVGRISRQLDPNGVIGVDGTSGNDVWAVTDQCLVATSMDDGGFDVIADLGSVASRCYSMKVTPDGVFIAAFGGVAYRTRFTDGGFDFFSGLPVDISTARVWNISGGAGAIHLVGDDGPISSVNQAYFITLIPQTR